MLPAPPVASRCPASCSGAKGYQPRYVSQGDLSQGISQSTHLSQVTSAKGSQPRDFCISAERCSGAARSSRGQARIPRQGHHSQDSTAHGFQASDLSSLPPNAVRGLALGSFKICFGPWEVSDTFLKLRCLFLV